MIISLSFMFSQKSRYENYNRDIGFKPGNVNEITAILERNILETRDKAMHALQFFSHF